MHFASVVVVFAKLMVPCLHNASVVKPAGATVQRTYWAIVENVPGSAIVQDSGMINMPIGPHFSEEAAKNGPKPASTHFQVLARHSLATWLRLQPKTGAPTSDGYSAPIVEAFSPTTVGPANLNLWQSQETTLHHLSLAGFDALCQKWSCCPRVLVQPPVLPAQIPAG